MTAALLCAGCTHDFDAFTTGAPEGDASINDGAKDTLPTSDGTSVACTESGAKTFGGHCYFALSGNRNWDSGRTGCTGVGAHLVTISSAAEESFVETISGGSDRWIGLSRPSGSPVVDASFSWVTGEAFSFKAWASGEPNDSGLCVRIRTGGQWSDTSCNNTNTAICERE